MAGLCETMVSPGRSWGNSMTANTPLFGEPLVGVSSFALGDLISKGKATRAFPVDLFIPPDDPSDRQVFPVARPSCYARPGPERLAECPGPSADRSGRLRHRLSWGTSSARAVPSTSARRMAVVAESNWLRTTAQSKRRAARVAGSSSGEARQSCNVSSSPLSAFPMGSSSEHTRLRPANWQAGANTSLRR